MWESVGFIIAFAYSNYLCTNAKLYILTSMLLVGMACYLVVEITLGKQQALKIAQDDVPKDKHAEAGGYEMITNGTVKEDDPVKA